MSLSRYEEIVIRFAAARIAAGGYPDVEHAVQQAQFFENYFQARELEILKDRAALADLPSILRPQAE